MISITEAARINNVTRQAIYVAIQQDKLKAVKQMNRWFIKEDDLAAYTASKYSRKKSTFGGETIFSDNKFSPKTVAKILDVPVQQIYYAIRTKQLLAERTGEKNVTCVVAKEALIDYKQRLDAKKTKAKSVSKQPENQESAEMSL